MACHIGGAKKVAVWLHCSNIEFCKALLIQGFGCVGCDNWNELIRSWMHIDLIDLLPCEMDKAVLSDTVRYDVNHF